MNAFLIKYGNTLFFAIMIGSVAGLLFADTPFNAPFIFAFKHLSIPIFMIVAGYTFLNCRELVILTGSRIKVYLTALLLVPLLISAIGNLSILQTKTIALFCSVQCPGDLILKTYDLAVALREQQKAVISGFHSPMEQECFTLLFRGSQPVLYCPARSLDNLRLKSEWKTAIAQNRLLLLSPFASHQHRATAELAQIRNQFVAAIADAIFIAYANPSGRTIAFAQQVLAWGKPLITLDSVNNSELITMGAKSLDPSTPSTL